MAADSHTNDSNGHTSASLRPGSAMGGAPLQALRQFIHEQEAARGSVERCELCSDTIATGHRHLLELAKRALVCVCNACAMLFSEEGAGGEKYRLVPRRYLLLADFHLTEEQWDDLMIPVNIVYIFRHTQAQRVMAFYPSPAGAIESLLKLESWKALVSNNPILNDLTADVEALLINRVQDAREHYIVPIDACYQLVGLIRVSWKGLSGGDEARQAIAEFFKELRAKCQYARGEPDARSEL